MQLTTGHNLLHYRLVAQIGEGGMGVVWKAVDTTLDREVAIKVLPANFAEDDERLLRFEREAKLLASLNHPNVAAIYGIHKAEAVHFLAMELIEGEDLRERMTRGALSVDEAVRIAYGIARGFEAAHARGIIHRDLKPANVKLTTDGTVKVLDFGLAKAMTPDTTDEQMSPSMSPTLTSAGTMAGAILGTASYMSPEQAKGKPVDRRGDIWSFGVVLFELIAGKKLFQGETVSETLAAVLMKDADWNGLPANTPAPIRRLLQRCLTRDPENRLQDIGDARIVLQEVMSGEADLEEPPAAAGPTTHVFRRALPWLTVAVLMAFAAGWFVAWLKPTAPPAIRADAVLRFDIRAPEGVDDLWNPIGAPDDSYVVYRGHRAQDHRLYLHDFRSGQSTPIANSEGAWHPFLSPDGRWIAFREGSQLLKVRRTGGDPVKICDVPAAFPGATWSADGTILFPPGWLQGLHTVSAEGGDPVPLTTVDVEAGEKGHWWPHFLPGGEHALFTIWNSGAGLIDSEIAVLDVETGSYRKLFRGADAWFLRPGYIVYYRAGTYHAIAFDLDTLETVGDPVPVLEDAADLAPNGNSNMGLTVSAGGTLYYSTRQDILPTRLQIVEPGKEPRPLPFAERPYGSMSLSPDGVRILTDTLESGNYLIRMLDLESGTEDPIALAGNTYLPWWKPDGTGFAFLAIRKGDFDIYFKDIRGGHEQPLRTTPTDESPFGWTPDGKQLFFWETQPDGSVLIKAVSVDDLDDDPIEVRGQIVGDAIDSIAVSPDGSWLAHEVGRGRTKEVYVRSYPGDGAHVRVSRKGGFSPAWAPDGTELYYGRGSSIIRVSMTADGDRIRPGDEEILLDVPMLYKSFSSPLIVLGKRRFVVPVLAEEPGPLNLKVVLNWHREVAAKLAEQ